MKELFLDEGLEDRVLDDLRHLWETKVMQSKAMEDFRKNNINSSDFVLQLPANYPRTNTQTLATFSLPASLAYPVQIPAGVTLQTASGQLYKVNVPVVVTQAPVGHQPVSNVSQKVPERSEMPAPQPVAVAQNPVLLQEPEPPSAAPHKLFTIPCLPKLDLDYTYSQLSDIVQLDGAADNSDPEEDEDLPLEENDFLGLINAEAIRALKEENGSDSNSISSSSDDGVVDELDPLNSGDDVVEQDIPDLFDTDNVIVCQYDKIHRSKNRWKFHLKDGVMSYGGRDYVFSKAIGEAEW
uniref:General transcription factor IIA, 1-like n=1 Tax=Cyprinodon variegatus TaxID=28743 RepID=A0A3Q2CLN9_CYPVA